MTAEQLDLLADLEQEQADTAEQERRRAGDFTWTRSSRSDASCTLCHQPQVWHRAAACAMRGRGVCMAQYLTGNHVRYAAKHQPERLPEYIERARARQVDVDAILTELEQDTR